MKDPIPWQDTTELERQLLEAARRDVATPALRAKMAQALSSLPAQAASTPATTALSHGRVLFSHPALWGSLCAVIVAGALRWQSSSQATPAPARAQQSGAEAALPPMAATPAPAAASPTPAAANLAFAATQPAPAAAAPAFAAAQPAPAAAPSAFAAANPPPSAANPARAAAKPPPSATPARTATHPPPSAAAPARAATNAPPSAATAFAATNPPPSAAAPSATLNASRAASIPRAASLREELALLDSARSALAARDTALAFQLLDKHSSQFARAHLTPEAEALRIDAWAQRGETERVERLSRRFLDRHPAHPLAAHVAEIARLR